MDAYTVDLAMAALVGASLVAVSAYYMHQKTLNQLLELSKQIQRDDVADNDDHQFKKEKKKKKRNHSRASSSFRDVRTISGLVDSIAVGFHTLPEGKSRSLHPTRPTSPKSPVAGASAFESVEGSDEEDNMTDNAKFDSYLHTNGNAGPDSNGEMAVAAAPSMIRSHSVTGDLHGVQPDPIAADILRKEPEQETFVRMKISPRGREIVVSMLLLVPKAQTEIDFCGFPVWVF